MENNKESVIIPFGNLVLALDMAEFEKAVQRGREFQAAHNGKPAQEAEKILTAEEAAQVTKVPQTWFLEQARRGKIPVLDFGKYKRFSLNDVLRAVRSRK